MLHLNATDATVMLQKAGVQMCTPSVEQKRRQIHYFKKGTCLYQ